MPNIPVPPLTYDIPESVQRSLSERWRNIYGQPAISPAAEPQVADRYPQTNAAGGIAGIIEEIISVTVPGEYAYNLDRVSWDDAPATAAPALPEIRPDWRSINYSLAGPFQAKIEIIVSNEAGDFYYRLMQGDNMLIGLNTNAPINSLVDYIIASGVDVFPNLRSHDFALLQDAPRIIREEHNLTTEGTDMPISRAAPPNEFSFIITFSPGHNTYSMTPPAANEIYGPNNGETWRAERHRYTNVENAYSAVSNYVEVSRRSTGMSEWNIWPSRRSNYYTALLNRQVIAVPPVKEAKKTNNSNIKNNAEFIGAIRSIKKDPANAAYELLTVELSKYIKFAKACNAIAAYEKLTVLLSTVTAIDFVSCVNRSGNGDSILVHPNNVVDVQIDSVKGNTRSFAKSQIIGYAEPCSWCSTYIRVGYLVRNVATMGKHFCHECLDEAGYVMCRHCGETHASDKICSKSQIKPYGHIYSYGTNVRGVYPAFGDMQSEKKIKKPKLRYGVEVELLRRDNVSINDAAYAVAKSMHKHAIIKSDSSIGENGFEVVTIPATLDYHRTKLWNAMFEPTISRENGKVISPAQMVHSWDTGTCGIHVHISRSAMTRMQLSKLLVFYHEDKNNAFLSRIAGRKVGPDAYYCKTAKKKLGYRTVNEHQDHHEAITISSRNGGKTAEVRIFRGNATKHGIIRCIEFVDATVRWCGQTGGSDLSYGQFLKWFDQSETRSQYPDLWRHLMQTGYLKTKHKSNSLFSPVPLELPEGVRIA